MFSAVRLVIVPEAAGERRGIQLIVTVKANGANRAEVKVGQPVYFTARIEMPPNTGKIVTTEWDFEGNGTFQ